MIVSQGVDNLSPHPLISLLFIHSIIMAVAISPIHRQFTTEQSSAIQSITLPLDSNDVVITYHSNPDKAYVFTASDSYIQFLADLLNNDELRKTVSIGSTIADGRKTEELKPVTI